MLLAHLAISNISGWHLEIKSVLRSEKARRAKRIIEQNDRLRQERASLKTAVPSLTYLQLFRLSRLPRSGATMKSIAGAGRSPRTKKWI